MYDLEGVRYIDISPTISDELAVFPGDVGFRRKVSMSTDNGDHITLSSISTTLHIGAHADAPNHYAPNQQGISDRALDYYLGPCQVIEAFIGHGQRVLPDDIMKTKIETSRVLIKTNSYRPNTWNENFNSLSSSLIEYLAKNGVKLVGLDTPSIDPADSKDMPSHALIQKYNMSILEGLDLYEAPAGKYQLIALPLRIKDADASPVRAILIPYE